MQGTQLSVDRTNLSCILIGGEVVVILVVFRVRVRGVNVDIVIVMMVVVMVVVGGRRFHNGLPSYHNYTKGGTTSAPN